MTYDEAAVLDAMRSFPRGRRVPRQDVLNKTHLPVDRMNKALAGLDNVALIEPLDYPHFSRLLAICDIMLTDSGGVQEEAPALGKPVLVLRHETERPEAVDAGVVKLVGPHFERIVTEAQRLLDDPAAYRAMAKGVSPYGDGRAAARIVRHLRESLA